MRHKIFRLLTLLALGWMGAACSSEKLQEPPAPWSPTDGVPTLTVSLGVEGATRSSEDDKDFEPGTGYENYLDIAGNDYRIYFFDANNKYLATFDPYLKPSANVPIENGISYYNFMGKVPSNVGTNFKLVVLANWGTYPEEVAEEDATDDAFQLIKGKTTIEDLTTHSATQFEALTSPGENEEWLGPKRLIPFYGVRAYDLRDEKYGVNQYIGADGKLKGDIYVDLTKDALPMLRAMAKVEVILNNAFASFSSVKMTRYNSKGFCAPYKENEDEEWNFDYTDYFHGYVWGSDFSRGVHLVKGKNDTDPKELEFKKISSRTEGEGNEYTPEKWVAYVPEYKNIGVEDFTTIEVELKKPDNITEEEWAKIDGDKKKKTIYFATDGTAANNAVDDKRYDIERNNIYRFTISGMTTTLECQVDIQPFAEQKLVVDLGLMRDESGDLMVVPDADKKLPDFFVEYMESKSHPKDKYTGEDLVPEADGDYYAIRLGSDGDIKNAEVLLKDSDGCHVLTNFGKVDGTANYNTREVYDYTTGENYHKDKDGDQRLQYNDDYSSIVLDHDKTMYYKTNPFDPPMLRYRVESWDPSVDTNPSGIFYYWKEISRPYTATEENIKTELGVNEIPDYYKYLLEVDKDGNPKTVVTITIYEGDKTAAEHKEFDKVLEEYTDELKDMLSTKPAYIIID